MTKNIIAPFMIPPKRKEQPAQIPLPAPEPPSIYDRRPQSDSDRDRGYSIDGENDDSRGYTLDMAATKTLTPPTAAEA